MVRPMPRQLAEKLASKMLAREGIGQARDRGPRRFAAPRQAVDRGFAVPEYERRPGAGVFRRRHGRGDHHRALADPLAIRDRRDQTRR